MNTPTSQLTSPPYLQWNDLRGRIPLLTPLWDGSEWHCYIDLPGYGLLRMSVVDIAEMHYLAKEPARPNDDVYLHFLDRMYQCAYWPGFAHFIQGISSDIRNCGASLAKIDHFFAHREVIGTVAVQRFVETEVEYLVGVCRSLLDLLHDLVSRMWSKVELREGLVKRELPEKLSRVMLNDGTPRTADEIDNKWAIGKPLATFYADYARFFAHLRRYRDNIIHHGHNAHSVLVAPRGFAINRDAEPFLSLGVWTPNHHYGDKYASLRPAVAALVLNSVSACEAFMHALEQTVMLPPEVAPGYRLFLRSPHGRELNKLKDVRDHLPWWLTDDEPVEDPA